MNLHDAILSFADVNQDTGLDHIQQLLASMHTKDNTPSPTLFDERCAFINESMAPFFQENALDLCGLEPLDNGGTAFVLNCGKDFVLKVMPNTNPYPYDFLPANIVLHPVAQGYSRELAINYEIAQKAEKGHISLWKHLAFQAQILRRGCLLVDGHASNFGFVKNDITNKKELRIIDSGAVVPSLYYKKRHVSLHR